MDYYILEVLNDNHLKRIDVPDFEGYVDYFFKIIKSNLLSKGFYLVSDDGLFVTYLMKFINCTNF